MSILGQIHNGVVVFEQPVPFAEGTPVRVEPVPPEAPRTLAELFGDVIGSVTDLPPDMAEQHDHYLYGTPKK